MSTGRSGEYRLDVVEIHGRVPRVYGCVCEPTAGDSSSFRCLVSLAGVVHILTEIEQHLGFVI